MVLTFGLLAISVCAVWLQQININHCSIPIWSIFLCASMISGFFLNYIEINGICWIVLFGFIAILAKKSGQYKVLHTCLLFITGGAALLLASGRFSGFINPAIVTDMRFSPDDIAFTHHLHFDATAVGIILMAVFCNPVRSTHEWRLILKKTYPIIILTLIAVLSSGVLLHYITVDVKFIPYSLIFLVTNLLFTCVVEEAFFRGFVQEQLARAMACWPVGHYIAALLSALLFGISHIKGGYVLVLLASLAGLFYSHAYLKIKRIEASILTHFSLNAVHFLAFTYPNL